MFYHAKKDFANHGVVVEGLSVDIKKMMDNKAKAVSGLTGGIEFLFKKYKVDYVKGWGKLSGPNSVEVSLNTGGYFCCIIPTCFKLLVSMRIPFLPPGSQVIEGKNIILAVGSEVTPLPTCPVDNAGKQVVDSTGALELDKIPKSLSVIGGGVIGLEMGSVWKVLILYFVFFTFSDLIT